MSVGPIQFNRDNTWPYVFCFICYAPTCPVSTVYTINYIFPRNPKGKDSKIAIIGAGLAGIGAAITLIENGCHDVTILEAQDYVGGRTNSKYYGGTLVDTGAQWLHGKNNPLYITAIENNLLSENITGEGLGIMVRSDGSIVDKNLVDDSKSQIENILEELEAWKSNDYQLSVGEFLENRFKEYTEKFPPKVRLIQLEIFNWYKLFLVNDNSCYNLNDLSIRNFKNYDCPGGQDHVTLKNGYKSLIDVLVNKLPSNTIQLNSAVTKITIEKSDIDSTVLLECVTGETVACDYLINTMPLGVLKSFRASIPYLPKSISDAISNMGYDSFGKIVLIFDYKWWDFEGCQFLWECGENAETTVEWVKHIIGFDVFDEDNMMMVGWVGGNAIEEMEKLTEDQVGEYSVNVLRKFLRNYTIPYPIKTYRSTWLSNPWIRGGHSYLSTACDRSNCDNSDLAKPVYIDGRMKMLFAGEAVNSSHFSTTHGAFQSGQAQAKVLYQYLVDA